MAGFLSVLLTHLFFFSFNFSSVVVCIFHFYCSVFLVFVLPSGVIKNDKNYKYKMIQQDRIIELDREDQIKDLGVIFDEI